MPYPEFTTEELATEEWRDIPGYEGIYQASTLGRIKRTATQFVLQSNIKDPRRYPKVTLSKQGRVECFTIHHLITLTFIGPRPRGHVLEVNHKDGDKNNARTSNLEYVTPTGNRLHAFKMGLMPVGENSGPSRHRERWPRGDRHYSRTSPDKLLRGERVGTAKLTESDVRAIRQDSRSHATIAADYKVDRTLIGCIKNRKIWKHVK